MHVAVAEFHDSVINLSCLSDISDFPTLESGGTDKGFSLFPSAHARAPHHLVLSWPPCGGGFLSVGHTTRTLYTHCVVNPCPVYPRA